MNDRIEDRARFDLVRYANCWEDADILLQALEIRPEGAYLSDCRGYQRRAAGLSGPSQGGLPQPGL
jgi:hypothetical protein